MALLNKLVSGFKEFIEKSPRREPAEFNDPLALECEWSPLISGGSNFSTHKLVRKSSQRLEFQATFGAKAFSVVFIAIGLVAFVGINFSPLTQSSGLNINKALALLVPLIFVGVGSFFGYRMLIPTVFDKTRNYFWKNRKPPERGFFGDKIDNCVRLDQIRAIQLISEYISSSKSSYYSHELNLVINDTTRLNVIDHGNANKILADAEELAIFLDVPVWNALR